MSEREFAQFASRSGVLTAEEVNSIYDSFNGFDLSSLKWKRTKRRTLLKCSSWDMKEVCSNHCMHVPAYSCYWHQTEVWISMKRSLKPRINMQLKSRNNHGRKCLQCEHREETLCIYEYTIQCKLFIESVSQLNQTKVTDDGLWADSTRSKQWRIELLCRYKQAKTSGITVLNIRKLYLYFVYFKNCMFTLSWARKSLWKWCARTTWKVACL